MKKITYPILTVLLIVFFNLQLAAQEVLTNESVVSLINAKVKKELIVAKIKSTPNKFDMSSAGLISLKKQKVVDGIVEEMLLATTPLPPMKNEDVITLNNGGVSNSITIKKIQYSPCEFNTSSDALVALKNAKVPDPIMKTMMEPKTNSNLIAAGLPPHPQDLPAPDISIFTEAGVYYEQYVPKTDYLQIEPTTTNQTKSGDFGQSALNGVTGGISGTTQRVGLANTSASTVIQDARPVFYLVFSGENRKDMNTVKESMSDGVASPNDFVLMRAKSTSRGREITIARQSSYTKESGFGEGAVPFRFKKISNNIYKVYFENDIAAGEYAFYYNKGSDQKKGMKLYDFSLQNNKKK